MTRAAQGVAGEVRRDPDEQGWVGYMRSFFQMTMDKEKQTTMREVADHMDKSARQCRAAGLEIPDLLLLPAHWSFIRTTGQFVASYQWRVRLEQDEAGH
jgi:hypothetical protein